MSKDLKQLREIQETGSLIYYDTLDSALIRRGIRVVARNLDELCNIIVEFKGLYYISEQAFYDITDDEYWTEWREVGLITHITYEIYELD